MKEQKQTYKSDKHEKLYLTIPNTIPYSYLIFLPFGQKDGWEKISQLPLIGQKL